MSPKKMTVCLMVALLAGVTAGASQPAWAGIIKWKDDQGKVHFTNDISKIPKKYRDQDTMEKMRGAASQPAPSAPAQSNDKSKEDDGILSKEEIGKIQTAKSFLQREMQFAKAEDTSFHMPTSLRAFGKKFTSLNADRERTKKTIDGTDVPSLQKVVAHIDSALKAAEANPNWMRKISAANTIKRVKSEVSANPGLIAALQAAEEESRKKEKEKEEKAKTGKDGKSAKKDNAKAPAPK